MVQKVNAGLDTSIYDTNVSLPTIQASKKKWKRMARGDTSSQPDMVIQPSGLGSAKRNMIISLSPDKKKKAKVEDDDKSMDGFLTAEAALQPCRYQ